MATISASFEGMDFDGTTTDAHVWHNGMSLFGELVNGFGLISQRSYQGTVPVNPGDRIDFSVGYGANGNFTSDSTLVTAKITLLRTSTNEPPSIWSQPKGCKNIVGETVRLEVIAAGTWPLAYQWFKGSDRLEGATNSVLILTNATEVASGDYTVAVSNEYGSVTSAAARVDVTLRTFPYVADFESTVGPEWSNRKTEVTPVGNRRFLGQFGNDKISLVLNGLPPHTTVIVSCDLFIIRSWDGSYPAGGDVWDLRLKNGQVLLHTTFSNHPEAVHNQTQAFPGEYPGASFTPRTGAQEVNSLGYVLSDPRDAVYRLAFTFPHMDQSLTLDFSGSGLQELGDESWGLDNVTLALDRSDALFAEQPRMFTPESSGQVNVNLGRASLAPLATTVTIDYATADDAAKAGQDYAAVMGMLTFGPGETNKTISIPILDDALVESEEQFRLTLSNPSEGLYLGTAEVVIRIEDNDFPTEWTDTFENLNWWIPFGDPPPRWVSSFQGRSGVFDNNGDDWYDSGAISKQRFDLSTGYMIESEVYLELTTRDGYWACAVSGIADPQFADWGGYNPRLLFGLWETWNDDNGTLHGALCASYETEGGTETFWDPWDTPDGQTMGDRLLSRWCTLTIIVSPDGFPVFLADGVPFYEGKKPVSSRLRSGTGQLYLGSRSSDWPGKAYHDSISFYQLERSTAVALNLDHAWVDPDTNAVHQVALGDDRVFLATDRPMVRVLDLDGSGKPELKGSWEPFLSVSDLAVSGSTLFVAGWELDFLSTIDRVDFANPAQPVSRGFCDTPAYVTGLALGGNHLFVAEDEEGLEILDLSREPFPAVVGQYPTTGSAVAVRVAHGKAYLATTKSLLILDVSNPAEPARLGALYLGGEVTGLEVAGQTAYILNRQSGLHLIDVSNPAQPTERSVYRRATAARALALSGPYVFLAAGWQGLQVLEVPDAGEPKWLTSYGTSSPAEDVAVVGNRVWVAAGAQGLLGFELLDGRLNVEWPASPAQPLALSWQAEAGWQLEQAESLTSPDWTLVPGSATTNRVSLALDLAQAFFRLRKP